MSGAGYGDFVWIRKQQYLVVGVGAASTDTKFWGKRKFTLRNLETGELFFGYAKSITANMSLSPYTVEG